MLPGSSISTSAFTELVDKTTQSSVLNISDIDLSRPILYGAATCSFSETL